MQCRMKYMPNEIRYKVDREILSMVLPLRWRVQLGFIKPTKTASYLLLWLYITILPPPYGTSAMRVWSQNLPFCCGQNNFPIYAVKFKCNLFTLVDVSGPFWWSLTKMKWAALFFLTSRESLLNNFPRAHLWLSVFLTVDSWTLDSSQC